MLTSGTVLGAPQFANVVRRGVYPTAWLERGLIQLLQNRRRAKSVIAAVGGLTVVLAVRRFIGYATQGEPHRGRALDLPV